MFETETVNELIELEMTLNRWGMCINRVPVSRFRRELRKWIRHIENTGAPVIITQRFGPDVIFTKVAAVQKAVDTSFESA